MPPSRANASSGHAAIDLLGVGEALAAWRTGRAGRTRTGASRRRGRAGTARRRSRRRRRSRAAARARRRRRTACVSPSSRAPSARPTSAPRRPRRPPRRAPASPSAAVACCRRRARAASRRSSARRSRSPARRGRPRPRSPRTRTARLTARSAPRTRRSRRRTAARRPTPRCRRSRSAAAAAPPPRSTSLGDLDDGALDAAAGDGAGHLAVLVDGHLRAGRARRRALHADHGGEGDPVAAVEPRPTSSSTSFIRDLLPSARPSAPMTRSSCPDRNWSTCGSAARMPRVSGS